MTTAYEEALKAISSGEEATDSNIPSYMVASDTLNIANNNKTFLESAVDAIDSIPKFIGASMISGANQLYNIPADIGNLFGGDFERADTGEIISSLDSNLGAFYQEHQEGTDLVGFMMSSAIPGIGGIKVLNAGQKSLRTAMGAGKFGENTGKALGLLSNSIKKPALDKALLEATTNSSAASLLSRNALTAVAGGLGQNALEALAFETAVSLTLFNSPILENQDLGDFAMNVAFGAGVFGLVGGTIDATKISFSLKSVADKAAVEARPWTSIAEPAAGSSAYEKLVLNYAELNNIPPIPTNIESSRQAFLKTSADTKRSTLQNKIREELGALSGGDQEVAGALFQGLKGSSFGDQQAALLGAVDVTKYGATSKIAVRAEKLQAKLNTGQATVKELEELEAATISTSYAKMWGEGAGSVSTDRPVITALSDTLEKGQKITVDASGVKAGNFRKKFNLGFNEGKPRGQAWNILTADVPEAQARYIWAAKLDPFTPTAKKPLTLHVNDIPLMEKAALELTPEQISFVKFVGLDDGEFIGPVLRDFLADRKIKMANNLLKVRGDAGEILHVQDEIAAMINVRSSFLSGEVLSDSVSKYNVKDLFAMQSHADEYTEMLVRNGSRKKEQGLVDIWDVPQHVKITYDTKPFAGIDNHVLENMAIIKGQQKLYQEGTSRASANVLGEDYAKFTDINSGMVFDGAVPSGAGPGLATAASANYGTLAAITENIGKTTSRVIEKFKQSTRESLEPLLYKLGNNQEAAVEWSTLNSKVRSIEGNYALNSAGDALEPIDIVRWKRAAAEASAEGRAVPKQPTPNPNMEPRIELKSSEVRELAKAHIELNGNRTNGLAGIRTAQGNQYSVAPEAFYPIPINPNDFPHFAMVIDDSITGAGHSKTLFASTAEELQQQANKLKENPQLTVLFKQDAEDYFKSIGQHSYEKTINNAYIDTAAHRKGVSAPFIVATDPQKITTDMLSWHMQKESSLVREAVTAKYEVQFRELQRLGDEFTKPILSKFGDLKQRIGVPEAANNPFGSYINTALGVKPTESYPWWAWTNTMADAAVSNVLRKASNVVRGAKSPEQLQAVNDMLKKAGYKGAHYDESMEIFANTDPARGALSSIVQKANSIMATVVLRWDALNAVNNAVSANVLLGAETKAVISFVFGSSSP